MSRIFTCSSCGKVLTRHTQKTHEAKWCPATRGAGSRRCYNEVDGCTNHFLVEKRNSRQKACSQWCQNRVLHARSKLATAGTTEEQREEQHMAPKRREEAFLRLECARTEKMVKAWQERSYGLWADLLGLKEAA